MPNVTLFGRAGATRRTPTFAVDIDGIAPAVAAAALGANGCFVWSGDYYAYEVMHRLSRASGGLVRIGFVHYNTEEEVDRVLAELAELG
jgi:selenocysteine lyase/cysteine desulfurase